MGYDTPCAIHGHAPREHWLHLRQEIAPSKSHVNARHALDNPKHRPCHALPAYADSTLELLLEVILVRTLRSAMVKRRRARRIFCGGLMSLCHALSNRNRYLPSNGRPKV